MRVFGFGGTLMVAGVFTLALAPHAFNPANARGHGYSHASHGYARYARHYGGYTGSYSSSTSGGSLQCVPFARENTGIELSGNANTWWDAAQGVYERGARPEVGSILNFRATTHMHMGHVAVVSSIVNARTVLIDHANWSGRGSVAHDTSVVDVSPGNDWTAVRVAINRGEEFGSIYPTYGFIYDRPDQGTMVANNGPSPTPVLNAAPRDLRPATDRMIAAAAPQEVEEVAEAADDTDVSQPRFNRVGRHLVRVYSRGRTLTTSFAHSYAHTYAPTYTRGFTSSVGRSAQVLRIHGTTALLPATHKPGHHRTRG